MKELKGDILNGGYGSFISNLWRHIVIKDDYYKYIIRLRNSYLSKTYSDAELSNTEVNLNKTNIDNKIIMDDMTWKNFIFLIKEILNVKNIVVTVKITVKDKDNKDIVFSTTKNNLDPDMISKIWSDLRTAINNKYFLVTMDSLIDGYLERNKEDPLANSRVNLLKKIKSTRNVTWKTLMLLVDDLLEAKAIEMSIKLTHNNDTTTNHKLEYELR